MNVDTRTRLAFADENLAVAELAMENGYFNACLQNTQQAVEKYLKAGLLTHNMAIQKTHSVEALNLSLQQAGCKTDLCDDDCDLLDSIYIPSKYPTQSVLPDFEPDRQICLQCVTIAKKLRDAVTSWSTIQNHPDCDANVVDEPKVSD